MPGTDGATAIRFDGLTSVAVADVENELAKRADAKTADGMPLMRTCALNLIVYVEAPGDAQAVADLIEPIAAAHPMRVIQVMLDPAASETQVAAWVDLDCGEESKGRPLCSERIALLGNPNASGRLISAVNALLSGDLPVVLWCRGGSPFLSQLFKGLAPLADKIVVDSILFGDGPASLDTLHRLSGLRGGRVALADMNWHRIATWRTTLAACFDDPAVLPLLPGLDRSEIEFSLGPRAKSAPPSARSLLLAGWIVSRLPTIAGHGDINGVNSAWATPGSIVSLCLRSSAARSGVTIRWTKRDDIEAAAYNAAGAPLRTWHFSPDPEGEADLLFRCIDTLAVDPVLSAALEVG